MSAELDNKAFVTGLLSNQNIDFLTSTFGIWVSTFRHVNYGIPQLNSGYSFPRPLVEDLASANYSITGQVFNFINFDGKSSDVKFLLTSGVKGINGYESIDVVADLSDSYFSGYKPVVVLPDMDFSGKLYRRYEATGLINSNLTRNKILIVSGEDWQELPNLISGNNTDNEYFYEDSNYSGYSNQSCARYKFLYNDSGKSIPQDFYEFELPIQLESNSILKYRICRRSDPIGNYEIPYFTNDGKILIDYSQYKNEISGVLEGSFDYTFEEIKTVTLSKNEADLILNKNSVPIIKSFTGDGNTNESVTGVKFYLGEEDGNKYLGFDLLASGEYEDIYKVSFSVDRYLLNQVGGVTAYVLSGYNLGDGNNQVINLTVGDQVYPRLIQDGFPYKQNELSNLVDFQQILEKEKNLQDLSVDPQDIEATEEEESKLAQTIKDNFAAYARALNDELGDEDSNFGGTVTDIVNERSRQDAEDTYSLLEQNENTPLQKNLLPNYPLPKRTYTSDYFSNYLNSGEQYVLVPAQEYSLNFSYAAYGDEYGTLGYYIEEDESRDLQPIYRTVINTTSKGVYINETGFCDGQTAFYLPTTYYDGFVNMENGLVTEIPSSDGVIKKSNYFNKISWKSAINYFYSKNYIASFDIYPSFSANDYSKLLQQAFLKVKEAIGGPNSDEKDQDGFCVNGGNNLSARIFVEREIYTEDYNENQIQEISKSIYGTKTVITGISQATVPEEKLYCVQTFDDSDFTNNIPESFFPNQNYEESFTFDEFIPFSGFVSSSWNQSKVTTYYTGDGNFQDFPASVGNIYFQDKNFNPKRVFRAEFITGSASDFTYSNYSNSSVWNGSNNQQISISNQNVEKYSYHLFEYSSSNPMKFVKSNVNDGDIANITESNAVVLRFTKDSIAGKAIKFQANDGITYFYINSAAAIDSSLNLFPSDKVKFNLQAYLYELNYNYQDFNWVTFNENPINNNTYGSRDFENTNSIPRFFQDDLETTKSSVSILFEPPNGPYTSKNYEGTPIDIKNTNSLKASLFENLILVKEQNKNNPFSYNSNCTLDVVSNGFLFKGKAPSEAQNKGNLISFYDTRRLRITRVKYNFYIKDLTIIGDAGFSYSNTFNNGWEYKLQYKKKTESAWKVMGEISSFTKDKFGYINTTSPSPYFYRASDLETPSNLAMVSFRTNLPLFLDDNDFEFRVGKYEKLSLFSDTVDVIKKTNFLPTRINWTENQECQYYNIYQKDRDQNLTLIRTVNEKTNTALAIPDIKQSYVDLGTYNFGGINGVGYYDIVVSGVVPSVVKDSIAVSGIYGFTIGDSEGENAIGNVNSLQKQNLSTFTGIQNATYSSVINFNNSEYRTQNFYLEPKYNGFYFASSGANVSTLNLSNINFEAYVYNAGPSSISVDSSTVPTNQVAFITNNGAVSSVSSIQSNPAGALDLSDFDINQSLIIKTDVTITDSSAQAPKTIFVINESSSQKTITFGSATFLIGADKTAKLIFSTSPSNSITQVGDLLTNYDIQNDEIYQPSASLINNNFGSIKLSSTPIDFGVYNKSNNQTSIKNPAGTVIENLNKDSFNIVSWNGTTATVSQKEYFDDIKLYIKGNEENIITVLSDDIDVIISNFLPNVDDGEKSYFFLKDEDSNRDFNIKITNGSSVFLVPRNQQDIKLTVKKKAGQIDYSILYASNSPSFQIDERLEQLVLIKDRGLTIDIGYLQNQLKNGSFVYFVNKSGYDDLNITYPGNVVPGNLPTSIANNQIAKAYIVTIDKVQKVEISIINKPGDNNVAFSDLSFQINSGLHLTTGINILDMQFCGTEIKLPSVSDLGTKDLFLICRNRNEPNIINPTTISDLSSDVINTTDTILSTTISDLGQISANSIALRVFRNQETDTLPTIEKIPFVEKGQGSLLNENPPNGDVSEYFYINDSGSNSFVLRDFYNRKSLYNGNIFLDKKREFSVKSFDENNLGYFNAQSISFDYDPDKFVNGKLSLKEDDSSLVLSPFFLHPQSGTPTLSVTTALTAGAICVNFAYSNVLLTSPNPDVNLNENRLFKVGYNTNEVYPIYNEKEFFIARKLNGSSKTTDYYYEIKSNESKIDTVILPNTYSNGAGLIFKNWTSRTINVKQMSHVAGVSYETTLTPNEQTKITYSSSAWQAKVSNASALSAESIVEISFKNQSAELDSDHIFYKFYKANGIIKETFQGDSATFLSFVDLFYPTSLSCSVIDSSDAATTYTFLDANNGVITGHTSTSIILFGRLYNFSTNENFVVNDFYSFARKGDFVVSKGQFLNIAGGNSISKFKYIERESIDLTEIFQNSYSDIPSNWFIPIFDNIKTFHLPNLIKRTVNDTQEITETDIGSYVLGKKIIFVNTIGCSANSPNKVVNYSDSYDIKDLYLLNSLVVYEVKASGASYVWEKLTEENSPSVQAVYAKINKAKGIGASSTSEITNGEEFINLPNLKTFNIDINSFIDKQFRDLVLFNSASNDIIINATVGNEDKVVSLGASTFFKLSFGQDGTITSKSIEIGGTSSFAVIKESTSRSFINEDKINQRYPNLKNGTFIKYIDTSLSNNKSTYFIYDRDGKAKINSPSNPDGMFLNLLDLNSYSANKNLFIYGSAFVSDQKIGFYPYRLFLKTTGLGSNKFYVYNNSRIALIINFNALEAAGSFDVIVPSNTMIEISENSVSFSEKHTKGKFFISRKKNNINYINRIGVELLFDFFRDYDLSNLIHDKDIPTSSFNICATNIIKNIEYLNWSYRGMDSSSESLYSVYNNLLYYFPDLQSLSFNSVIYPYPDPFSTGRLPTLTRKITSISNSGHYVFSSADLSLRVNYPASSSIFLVNNTSDDIFTNIIGGEKPISKILYRNTVMIVSSDKSIRYIKKAKKRDEFYCVLNPKTTISTQREITLKAGIPRNFDILPILDADGLPQQSYVKIISKDGSSSYVYLNIRDYYNSKDIPTDSSESAVAYEVGIGHETIYKFLFYDPESMMFTIPGIREGLQYLVEIDNSLYRDLANLPGLNDQTERGLLEPKVKYNGIEYSDGEVFTGTKNPNYEVRYPNYVKVFRVVYDDSVSKVFKDQEFVEFIEDQKKRIQEGENIFPDTESTVQLPVDNKALLSAEINSNARKVFSSPITWIPIDQDAFWSSSNGSKDIWIIEEISSPQEIASFNYPENTNTSYAKFLKCKVKKINFKSPLPSFRYEYYSSLQERTPIQDPRSLTILLDGALNPSQRRKIQSLLYWKENRDDYLVNSKIFNLGGVSKTDLFLEEVKPETKDGEETKVDETKKTVKESDFQISVSLFKFKNLPSITFDDVSTQEIVKLINGE